MKQEKNSIFKIHDIRKKLKNSSESSAINLHSLLSSVNNDSDASNPLNPPNTTDSSLGKSGHNITRRTVLKYAFFGSGLFILGKIFGPSLNFFDEDSKITDFKNFRVIESKLGLQFFDKMGNEILALDKED